MKTSNRQRIRRLLALLAAASLFLLGLQLMRSAVGTLGPWLEVHLQRVVVGDLSALGLSWLASYVLMNGSVVAAVALTFVEQEVIQATELVMMLGGSRLGAAGIVVAVGAIDYFQRRELSISRACAVGILSFLLTHAQSIPALGLSYLWTHLDPVSLSEAVGLESLRLTTPPSLDSLTHGVVSVVGPAVALVAGVLMLYLALRVFDSVFEGVGTDNLRDTYLGFLANRWLSFLLGLLVTAVTLSVAFSLAVVVPLYNRGHVRDRHVIPYILGANIGTFFDTVVIALLIEPTVAIDTTLSFILATTVVTIGALLAFRPFARAIRAVADAIAQSDRRFLLFLLSLLLAPVLLLFECGLR